MLLSSVSEGVASWEGDLSISRGKSFLIKIAWSMNYAVFTTLQLALVFLVSRTLSS